MNIAKGRCVVRIEIEYADGLIEQATEDDAHRVWDSVVHCLWIAAIHGAHYTGPKLQPKPAKEEETA